MTTKRPLSAGDLVMVWHGLFAGSYVIAYLTAEGSDAVHQFAGYAALVLLALRLVAASLAGLKSPWGLPWAAAVIWKPFVRKLSAGDLSVFRHRTPLAPLSGLAILITLLVVGLSGLAAEFWDWEDLHEGVAEASLFVILIHAGLVSLGPLLRAIGNWLRPGGAAAKLS
jgi:cytochrome b